MSKNENPPFWTSQEGEAPAYTTQTEGGYFHLTHDNTVVRRFELEKGEFDHAVHQTLDGSGLLIFLNKQPVLNKYLRDNDYPTFSFTELDEATIAHYSSYAASQIDSLPDAA